MLRRGEAAAVLADLELALLVEGLLAGADPHAPPVPVMLAGQLERPAHPVPCRVVSVRAGLARGGHQQEAPDDGADGGRASRPRAPITHRFDSCSVAGGAAARPPSSASRAGQAAAAPAPARPPRAGAQTRAQPARRSPFAP